MVADILPHLTEQTYSLLNEQAMQQLVITDLNILNKSRRMMCLLEGQRLIEAEVLCEQDDSAFSLGTIHVGKVEKIARNINAAFVKLSPEVSGFLSFEAMHDPVFIRSSRTHINAAAADGSREMRPGNTAFSDDVVSSEPASEKSVPLRQDDEILVQIDKEAQKGKLASLTADLSIRGRYQVLQSGPPGLCYSKKLSKRKRSALAESVSQWMDKDLYGILMRTNAGVADPSDIRTEYELLKEEMDNLKRFAGTKRCYSCVKKSESALLSRLQNVYTGQLDAIITDRSDEYEQIVAFCSQYSDFSAIDIKNYRDTYPLAALYNLTAQIERALGVKVWMKSGGFLMIEPTEALTVIDVNSGKSQLKKSRNEHHKAINLEAAEEIARQIRLRNLSGIILVDFINLSGKSDYDDLMEQLKKAVSSDPVPVRVLDRTKLGLVEMTRKKTARTLAEQINTK